MSETARDVILDVQHLTMRFGGLVAIDNLSFSARRGGITAIIGPNGAGKTTVFNCVTGFYQPSEGMLELTHASGKKFLLERMPDFKIASRSHGQIVKRSMTSMLALLFAAASSATRVIAPQVTNVASFPARAISALPSAMR